MDDVSANSELNKATGTLPGGSGMETGHWLRPGDQLTLVIDQIGEISHPISSS